MTIRIVARLVLALWAVAGSRTYAAPPASAPSSSLQSALDQVLASHKPSKVQFAGCVLELSSGKVLYDHDADQPLMPASNMKLIVMSAALDQLGKDYHFKTTLAIRGKDLVVIGGGDPSFGDERLAKERGQEITTIFANWAEKLKAAGVTQVANLVIDDSIYDRQFVHPNWPVDQYETWYEAPIGGLNFNANCLEVRVKPGTTSKPAVVSLFPPNTVMSISNKTTTGGKQRLVVRRAKDEDAISASGGVTHSQQLGPISVRDPGMFFAATLRTVLAARGIHVDGKIVREKVRQGENLPPSCRVIATYQSPLGDTLARAGKQSLGMMAEGLIKQLGYKQSGVGSWTSGRIAVLAFAKKAGVPDDQITIDDGSGLSRKDRVSPLASTRVLQYIFSAKGGLFETLRKCLATAGIDGTLEKRMKSPEVKGRVFAKTGYINGVRTLAGYVHTSSDQWLAFAFFYNQAAGTRPLADMQDKACQMLVSWPNVKPPASRPTTRSAGKVSSHGK